MNRISHKGTDVRGMTLLTLVLVIAIFILCAIILWLVLSPLWSVPVRGDDDNVKNHLSSMRSQAEIYYTASSDGSYGNVPEGTLCLDTLNATDTNNVFAGQNGLAFLLKETNDVGGYPMTCAATTTAWSVVVTLPSGISDWCVDSFGASVEKPKTAIARDTGC